MTIKSSGQIAISDINTELAFNVNTPTSLNDGLVRSLLGKRSGTISLSDAYGKTKPLTSISYTIVPAIDPNVQIVSITGWDARPDDVANGWGFGSSSQSPLLTPSGARVVYIAYTYGGSSNNLRLETLDYIASLTVKINGVSYTFSYTGTNGVEYGYVSTGPTYTFVAGQSATLEFMN